MPRGSRSASRTARLASPWPRHGKNIGERAPGMKPQQRSRHGRTGQGPLVRILTIVLALLPLLFLLHTSQAEGAAHGPRHSATMVDVISDHGMDCPSTDGHGSGACGSL